jgi:antirestriction protein ArdC
MAHPFGSEGYAREELRAEIASLILGSEVGLGYDPGQHAGYVDHWVQILTDTPTEIL